MIPIYERDRRSKGLVRLGMIGYDVLSAGKSLERHRMLSPEAAIGRTPGLATDGLTGARALLRRSGGIRRATRRRERRRCGRSRRDGLDVLSRRRTAHGRPDCHRRGLQRPARRRPVPRLGERHRQRHRPLGRCHTRPGRGATRTRSRQTGSPDDTAAHRNRAWHRQRDHRARRHRVRQGERRCRWTAIPQRLSGPVSLPRACEMAG